MKKVIAITSLIALYSSELATAQNTMPPLPPRILKEDFVKYMAAAMVTGLYCEGLDLNIQYVNGFIDATGLVTFFAEPGYREEFDRREKEAKEDPKNFCTLAIIMFHKDAKPRAGIAPLLMNKSSE